MHHDGSVVLQKEEICTSCLSDVCFLRRRADSSDSEIRCCSTLLKTFSVAGLSWDGLVERELGVDGGGEMFSKA